MEQKRRDNEQMQRSPTKGISHPNDKEIWMDKKRAGSPLLYHRRLKCLVAIELKTTDFIPEYTGKMQFYLSVLDDKVKQKDENPSIGIIICKTKRRTIVEYALKNTGSPMGVAEYSFVLLHFFHSVLE